LRRKAMATTTGSGVSVELVPLAHCVVSLEPAIVLANTPSGNRYILGVKSARMEGDRLKASLKGTCVGDWLTVSADGVGTLDVRATLETDDGALILMHYNGRVDMSMGPGKAPIYAAPLFDTGDARYAWLNKIQTVFKGRLTGDRSQLEYEIFEVR
jgi:hypothetical protein